MALIGSFDAETNALEWFDPQIVVIGNYEYGFPWDHDLIDVVPPPPNPPTNMGGTLCLMGVG